MSRSAREWLAAACLGLILAQLHAQAGRVRIVVSLPAATIVGDHLEAAVHLRNDGDAAAFRLVPTLQFRGADVRGADLPVLNPSDDESLRVRLPLGPDGHTAGQWPIFVRVHYTDANNYAFEALHVGTVQVGDPTGAAPAAVALSGDPVVPDGHVEARIESPEIGEARLTFVAPAGLVVEPAVSTVRLRGSPVLVRADLSSESATPGSELPLFAVLERRTPEGYRTDLATVMVSVHAPAEADWGKTILYGLLVALVLTWVALAGGAAWRRRRRNAT